MPLPQDYRFMPLSANDTRAVLELDTWAFPDGQDTEDLLKLEFDLPWDRTVGVVAQGEHTPDAPLELAGMRSSYEFADFQIPGAEIPVAGLTWVGVHPGHRRRGILRGMIADHFAHCAQRGEKVSALFAAEAGIYGRFGYGSAAKQWQGQIPRGAALRDVPGSADHAVRFDRFDRDEHLSMILDIHRAAGRCATGAAGPDGNLLNRPGSATPSRLEHARSSWYDPPAFRDGKEAIRLLTVVRDGQVRGFASFRRQEGWGAAGPDGTVVVGDLAALDASAAHALWRALLDMDLTARVKVGRRPLDDPILTLLINPRAAEPVVTDNVWIRLVDLPGALAERRYAAGIDVVLGVTDDMLPANAGSWRLRADAFAPAQVTSTSDSPDLVLDTRELATAYLGGTSLASLASAGLVTEARPGALTRAAAAFAWPVIPGTTWSF